MCSVIILSREPLVIFFSILTVKCRKKFQSMGWPWLSLREMQLMSEVSDVFSSLDSAKIQLIFVCLFLRHCPIHLLVCSVGTSVWVVRWPSTAGGWRLRDCIFAKRKRAPKKRNRVKRGKNYGLLGTHFHFPGTFTLSFCNYVKPFYVFKLSLSNLNSQIPCMVVKTWRW